MGCPIYHYLELSTDKKVWDQQDGMEKSEYKKKHKPGVPKGHDSYEFTSVLFWEIDSIIDISEFF